MSWRIALSWLAAALLAAGPARAADIDELTTAAYRNNGREVTSLLMKGVDPNGRDSQGRSPLEVAIREESPKSLQALLDYPGLNIDAANGVGETPLMLAALKGQLDWVKTLAARGAKIDKDGWTPLHYACSGPDNGIAAWLIAKGAAIDARSPNGTTPLMMAARYGPYDLAEQLLKLGADPTLRNQLGLTAADFAAAAEREKLHKLLLQRQQQGR
ncbi:ankyrin repeat domain-containing protein [Roseateles violae]|uniref:Ankyrin repeat domain-containing protein n=1 Tax=Roseateles violae TaxID=3058042 RepID=A0ABT8DQM5_9BURK|nr:ankyrin repeat domain-containing protein [Pelomonas sp. PFR6]MDN3920637.1 ankyrin repeat domain-containing protein [Pelomonas sp. PFR6]